MIMRKIVKPSAEIDEEWRVPEEYHDSDDEVDETKREMAVVEGEPPVPGLPTLRDCHSEYLDKALRDGRLIIKRKRNRHL